MRRPNSGFTLLELMLVMAVLLVAAAISIPAIEAMMSDGRLKGARDMVQARWADIRGRAMQEGRPYKFSVMYGTGKFKIEPEDPDAPSDGGDDPNATGLIKEDVLPTGILFARDEGSAGGGGGAAGSGGYDTLAVYLEDGTARDDVRVMFGKEGNKPIGLQLRALTGAVGNIDPPQGNGP